MSESLRVVCPACSEVFAEDGWEVLTEKDVHQITCRACGTDFFFSWFECEACVADNVVSALREQNCLDSRCKKCGHHPTEDVGEDYEESSL